MNHLKQFLEVILRFQILIYPLDSNEIKNIFKVVRIVLANGKHILLTIYWHLHNKATTVPCAALKDKMVSYGKGIQKCASY